MTQTELQLLAVFRAPAVPLKKVCEDYLGTGYREACRQAGVNTLPVPAFRLTDSQRAPYMVLVRDLAAHIDSVAASAKSDWENSQV